MQDTKQTGFHVQSYSLICQIFTLNFCSVNRSFYLGIFFSCGQTTLLKFSIFQAYRRRWYILFSFSMLSLLQCAVWNTFGPIYESVKYAYDWSDATVALQANWGTFTFIIIVFPLCWLLEKYGLRITTIVVSTLVTFGATLRFVTTNVTVFSIFANICSILNGFAGMLSNLYL